MKICMIGLGSIGQRHTCNIKKVLSERNLDFTVDALRIQGKKPDRECEAVISGVYHSFEDLPDDYDAVFITNPTVFHYDTVRQLSGKTRHMFVEKPVFEKYSPVRDLNLVKEGIYYVACPLRHKKVVTYIKNLVEKGEKFNSVRAISSSYLPDWRKGADYREIYSAQKKYGGGVELDLIHEWDYITYLFGMPERMFKIAGRYSDLEIDSEDIAVYIAEYPDKTVELHLDYFGIEPVRILELFGNRKKYTADISNNVIKITEKDKTEKRIDFGRDDFYLSEMEYFFDLVQNKKKSFNEIERANTLLKFILGE